MHKQEKLYAVKSKRIAVARHVLAQSVCCRAREVEVQRGEALPVWAVAACASSEDGGGEQRGQGNLL